jgi:hypothetical protein
MNAELVVAPGAMDVAGMRLQVHAVAGILPLHGDTLHCRGAVKVRKLALNLDLIGAALGLLVLSPIPIAAGRVVGISANNMGKARHT